MRGRRPEPFKLKTKDERRLHELVRDDHTSLKVARRAQILLGRADAAQVVVRLGEQVERDRATIWRVCERYAQGGLAAALYDAPRAGRPRVFSPPRASAD